MADESEEKKNRRYKRRKKKVGEERIEERGVGRKEKI